MRKEREERRKKREERKREEMNEEYRIEVKNKKETIHYSKIIIHNSFGQCLN